MRPLLIALLILPTLAIAAAAQSSPAALCQAAIAQAEREANLPPRLLAAIGRVESGRRDPETGATTPWPWTINAEGRGSFFPDRAAAIAAVRGLQAQGVRSIDVGCMQINLRHHPNAFASLEEAFDPLANARYAARFLAELQASRGDWMRAAANYHSQTPEFAEPYRARVAAAWDAERGAPAPPGYAAALRAHGGFGSGGTGAAMLDNAVARGGAMLPPPGGGGGGRGLDAYRSQPITMVGRVTMPQPAMAMAMAPPARPAGAPAAAAGMPSLAAPGLGLPAPGRPATLAAGQATGLPAMAQPGGPPTPPMPPFAVRGTPMGMVGGSTFAPPRPAGPLIPLPARRS